jgi:hypothetical protein
VQNLTLTDKASGTFQLPIGNAGQAANRNIALKNVSVVLNRWMGAGSILPTLRGQGNEMSLAYRYQSSHSRLLYAVKGDVRMTLQAQPDTLSMAQSTVLTWASSNASACTASGAWSGAFATRGSVAYKPSAVGSPSFTLACHAGSVAAMSALPLQVTR